MFINAYRAASLATAALALAAFAPVVSAQTANREVVTKTDVENLVGQIAEQTGDFKDKFDPAVEQSMMDQSKLEDRAKHQASDLHDAARKLEDSFNNHKDKYDADVRNEADRTLAAATDIDRIVKGGQLTPGVHEQWAMLKENLNALASIYHLAPLP